MIMLSAHFVYLQLSKSRLLFSVSPCSCLLPEAAHDAMLGSTHRTIDVYEQILYAQNHAYVYFCYVISVKVFSL